jgi:uncharacterized protein (DUF2336 family)
MSDLHVNLTQLVELARERSSARRRELLRRMTDLFVAAPESYSERETEQFGEIVTMLAHEMEMEVRRTLAHRLAGIPNAPHNVMVDLANDEIEVAEPVLASSLALTEHDLVALARLKSQAHLRVIAGRPTLSAAVTDAMVKRGDDEVLAALARNDGAVLSRGALETMTERADQAEILHEPLIHRAGLPLDLLNALFFKVSASLKREIVRRTGDVDPALIDQAIHETEKRLQRVAVASDPERLSAEAYVAKLARSGPVTESLLASLARQRRFAEAAMVLARLAGLDLSTARRVLNDSHAEALAIVCRACRFSRQTFSTLALERDGELRTASEARSLIDLYGKLSVEAAERVMRFWRLRVHAAAGLAA